MYTFPLSPSGVNPVKPYPLGIMATLECKSNEPHSIVLPYTTPPSLHIKRIPVQAFALIFPIKIIKINAADNSFKFFMVNYFNGLRFLF